MMKRAVNQQNRTPDAMGRSRHRREKSWKGPGYSSRNSSLCTNFTAYHLHQDYILPDFTRLAVPVIKHTGIGHLGSSVG